MRFSTNNNKMGRIKILKYFHNLEQNSDKIAFISLFNQIDHQLKIIKSNLFKLFGFVQDNKKIWKFYSIPISRFIEIGIDMVQGWPKKSNSHIIALKVYAADLNFRLSLQTLFISIRKEQTMKKAYMIVILITGLIIELSICQQCTTVFNLDNILQDRIEFSPVSQDGRVSTNNQYFYPRTFFSSTPRIITSIHAYQVNSFSAINYAVRAVVSRSFVTFTFTAQNMNWVYMKLKFWLTSRVDLLVGTFVLQNVQSGSSSRFNITIPQNFTPFVNEKSIHLNFINGLRATSPNNAYSLQIKNAGKFSNNSIFSVDVNAYGQTNISWIEVSYAILNVELSFFASGGGQLLYIPIQGSEYNKIHGSFAPIIYSIQGFDQFNISSSASFNLQFQLDTDYVLQTNAGTRFQQLSVIYLTIGAQPQTVCKCDYQFILRTGCQDSCPPQTYPFVNYAKGGKSCLTCSPKLNQTINEFNTGCVCISGHERVGEYCIPQSAVPKPVQCLAQNTVLADGKCVCIAGTQLVNGDCITFCKANQNYNNQAGECECNLGYVNISGLCGVCSSDKLYNATLMGCVCPEFQFIGNDGNCQCIPNFFLLQNRCIQICPSGTTRVNNTCQNITVTCSGNQVLQNGRCVCTNLTYIVNGTCTTCSAKSYYNVTSQTCILCLVNCEVCFSSSSCSSCTNGYYYNLTSNTCQLNKTCAENEQLSNGLCICAGQTVSINGQCSSCLASTFFNPVTRSCDRCLSNCLSCNNATSCNTCLPNYVFNSTLGLCAQICGQNQVSVRGTCECISKTFRINGVCSTCQPSEFFDSNSNSCQSCMMNCFSCTNSITCDKCISTHYFNSASRLCQPSNCPINETIINGKCDCIDGTYRVSGVCTVCFSGQFYNNNSQICKACTDNCNRCLNLLQCAQCLPYFKLINGQCRFNLYDIKSGYPQFTQKVVITDFASSEPQKSRKLTAQQLKKIVQIEFSPRQIVPGQVVIQQNPKNNSEIRVLFAYCGHIPFSQYNTTYRFNDPVVSKREDIQRVNYNLLDKGLTNYLFS